jgi:hypothetical protein
MSRTPEPLDDLAEYQVSRYTDCAIAEHVLGVGVWMIGGWPYLHDRPVSERSEVPRFSASLDACEQVIDAMADRGLEFALVRRDWGERGYMAEFRRDDGNIGETTYLHGEFARSPALAVCLAALAAAKRGEL